MVRTIPGTWHTRTSVARSKSGVREVQYSSVRCTRYVRCLSNAPVAGTDARRCFFFGLGRWRRLPRQQTATYTACVIRSTQPFLEALWCCGPVLFYASSMQPRNARFPHLDFGNMSYCDYKELSSALLHLSSKDRKASFSAGHFNAGTKINIPG